MQVVAVKPAYFNDQLLRIGDEIDIPDRTKGSWFTPADSAEADAARTIKARGSTPVRVLDKHARGETVSLVAALAEVERIEMASALRGLSLTKAGSFVEAMNA